MCQVLNVKFLTIQIMTMLFWPVCRYTSEFATKTSSNTMYQGPDCIETLVVENSYLSILKAFRILLSVIYISNKIVN